MTRLIASLIAAAGGIALLLTGLGIDAYLHAGDPTLAEREGIFTLSNPGHALLGAGVALACAGVFGALHAAWGMARPRGALGRPAMRHLSLAAATLASVAAVGFALSVSAEGHDHGAAATEHAAHDAADAEAMAAAFTGGDLSGAPAHDHAANAVSPDSSTLVSGDMQPSGGAPAAHMHADAAGAESATVSIAGAPQAHEHVAATDAAMAEEGAMAASKLPHNHPRPTADELICRAALTEEAKVAAARFADVDVALVEGFVAPPDGKTHYGNRAYMRDGVSLDLAKPETLVYVDGTGGEKVLAGVMFRALKGTGPQPCGNATWWHTHSHCVDDATGQRLDGIDGEACPAGATAVEGQVEMLHLWFVPRNQR